VPPLPPFGVSPGLARGPQARYPFESALRKQGALFPFHR
jgi:hypothetical protein